MIVYEVHSGLNFTQVKFSLITPYFLDRLIPLWKVVVTCYIDSLAFVNFKSSVEEARYMLASRRRSFPCIGQNMPRTSLDMVIEEQSCETPDGDKGLTSLTSLGVPRHRSRSRSLDNTLETNNSFAAFKESLKVGHKCDLCTSLYIVFSLSVAIATCGFNTITASLSIAR